MLPILGKMVDVLVQVKENHVVLMCRDCDEEMNVRSILTATLVDNPDAMSINHNLQCPKCGGYAFIGLRSQR
jgi:Zn finger protein HypA/HybF involved in hydrogenase expression